MATITDVEAAKLRQKLHREHIDLMLAESPPLTKVQYTAAIQAIEDWYESERITVKGLIDTAVGTTISNSLAKKIGKFWMKTKWGNE